MRRISRGIRLFTAAAILGWGAAATCSDLVGVVPLTPTVIALHFDDGTVYYRGYHSDKGDDVVREDPLPVNRAAHPFAYRILSGDDANYAGGKNPLRVGRKSKPTAFSDSCIWTGSKCDNRYVLEHWIYLELPHALQRGRTYTIWVGNLAGNLDQVTFTYDEFDLRSELIHVNQHGYKPASPVKYAYLAHWPGDFGALDLDFLQGRPFYLVDMSDRSVAYQGTVTTLRRAMGDEERDFGSPETWGSSNNLYGSDVWEIDFSEFTLPGEYKLVVEGVGCSFPFRLDENVYREAYYHTVRGLYYQRAGIAKEEVHAGRWAQPRDHHPADGLTRLYYSTHPSILAGEGSSSKDAILDSVAGEITGWGWGWYHDAGDWDGYVHHAEVPYFLLASYELAPQNYRDNELNIPESGNGVPDILDEAGWLIEYFRRNIRPGGGVAGGRVHSDWNDKPDASPSYEDARPWYVCGEDPQTSYLFAGLAAQYAWCLELAGITGRTGTLLAEAAAAYQWAGANHAIAPDEDVKGAGLSDLRMYAAANLYNTTGEAHYQEDLRAVNRITSGVTSLSGDGYNQTKAVWSYITAPDHPNIDTALRGRLIEAAIHYAGSRFLDPAKKRSARVGYPFYMPPIVGSTTTPVALPAMFAQHVATGQQKQELIDCMHTTADYFLGNNPLNMSWITGLGDRYPRRMLHLDSRYDIHDVDPYVPGLVPYGPTRIGDHFLGEDAQGPWDADFAKIRSYPDRYQWPVSEFWFDNPYSVLDGEFTIHQTNAPAASTYGFLSADTTHSFEPNRPPVLTFVSPVAPVTVDESDSLIAEVEVTDDGYVAAVRYFLGHHPVATVTEPPFHCRIPVSDLYGGTWELRAVAVDNRGMESRVEALLVTIFHTYRPRLLLSTGADTLAEGHSLDVTIDSSSLGGPEIDRITLYLNGGEIGSDDTHPYEFHIDSLYPLFNEIKAVVSHKAGFTSSGKVQKYAVPGVAGVAFKKKAAGIHAGEYVTLEWSVYPPEAVNREVGFHSLNDSIAAVGDRGRVEALREGETGIVVTTLEGGFTDTAAVTVLPARPVGPYSGTPVILPAVIEAEHYDYGGEGFAYHDRTPGNSEELFRSEDVDVGQSYDNGTACHVTAIQPGEWLNYTVFAPEPNEYGIRFRYTAGAGDAVVTLLSDGDTLRRVALPAVSWYPFEDHLEEGIFLEEGEQTLTLLFENGKLTLNYFEVLCGGCTTILPQEINLNCHDLEVAVGGRVALHAALLPASATDKQILWESLADSIAFVDREGRLTALRTGTTKVVATTRSPGLTDTCRVRVLEESSFSPGLRYEYFEGEWDAVPDFSAMPPEFTGSIGNFDLSPAVSEDHFGFRFYGEISIDTAGTYHFYTASDDGSLLYINGVKVVDNDGLHATVEQGGTIPLDTGRHRIEVLYFEKGGGATLEVFYEGPGIPRGPVPDSILGTYVAGGELIPLNGIGLPDTIRVPLETTMPVPVEYIPGDASDRKVAYLISDPAVTAVDRFGYLEGLAEGTAEVTATARDGGHSALTVVRVVNDVPRVSILSPADQTHYPDTARIRIGFAAEDSTGGIESVTLYVDQELSASGGREVRAFEIGPLQSGEYRLAVAATDRHGATGHAPGITIRVNSIRTSVLSGPSPVADITPLPNPFSTQVQFRIALSREAGVSFKVFDLAGRLHHAGEPVTMQPGLRRMIWDGTGTEERPVAAGAYICTFLIDAGGDRHAIRRMVVRR